MPIIIMKCLLLLLLLVGFTVAQTCHSSCQYCFAYGSDSCTSCPAPLFYHSMFSQCMSSSSNTFVDKIDSFWHNSTAQYCKQTTVGGVNNTNGSTSWPSTGNQINPSSSNNQILFWLYNLPPMLNIELRITVEENLTLGNGSLVIVSNDQTSLYQVFQSNLTSQTFSIQLVNDGAVNKTIKVNGSTTGSSNSYFTLRDATFIYELCDSNCLTCFGSATSCTSCGLDPFTYAQLYLEQVSGTCVLFCSSNYLMSHPTYECDTCHTACLICFAASSNSSCLTCNNSGGYYVKSNNLTTTCALGCLSSQVLLGNPLTCTPCNASCSTCSGTVNTCVTCSSGLYKSGSSCVSACSQKSYLNLTALQCFACSLTCFNCSGPTKLQCTSCGLNSSNVQLYLNTTSGQCTATCSTNYLSNPPIYECNKCHAACLKCSAANSNTSCLSCNNNGGYVAYSSSKTNVCVKNCSFNQIIVLSAGLLACTTCNVSCKTCSIQLTNCTSCSSKFLVGNVCSNSCLDYKFSNTTSWTCQACSVGCLTCTGVLSNLCTACGNVTTSSGTVVYRKPSTLNECLLACPSGELVDPFNPNRCIGSCPSSTYLYNGVCSATCPSGLFGSSATASCVSSCSSTQYPDSSSMCQPCSTTACLTCTLNPTKCTSCPGSSFLYISASTCHASCPNTTYTLGTSCYDTCPSGYFMNDNLRQCVTVCPISQYADSTLKCTACSAECVTCYGSSTNCTGNICQANYYYYKNACLTGCPNNTYTFNGQCLEECPTGYVGSVSTISTCVVCSSISCQTVLTVDTTVVNGGSNYEHRVALHQGLSEQSNMDAIKNGLTVDLSVGSSRLLLTTVSLSVSSITLSAGRNFLIVLTNYYPADPWGSTVAVNFQAGTLLTSSGIPYNQLTGTVSLSNPLYLSSYYKTFDRNIYLQAEGIIFTLLSLLLFLGSFALKNYKLTNQCLAFVGMVQIFGLSRVRDSPYDFHYFDTVTGYSHYEMRFVPNAFAGPFYSNNYSETSIDSAVFAFGMQNFVVNFGSIFYFLMGFELILLAYLFYVNHKKDEKGLKLFKNLQEGLVNLWSVIILYGCALCLLSLQNNTISSSNFQYAFTILVSFLIISAYIFYFLIRVKEHINVDLYKVHNLFRMLSLLLLAHSYQIGFIVFNFSELFFLTAELSLYRKQKPNLYLYILEKVSFWVVMNASLLKINYVPLLIIAGIAFGSISIVKIFYFVKVVINRYRKDEKVIPNQSSDFIKMGEGSIIASKMQSQMQNISREESIKEKNIEKKSNLEKIDSFNTLNEQSLVFEPASLHQIQIPKALEDIVEENDKVEELPHFTVRTTKKRKSRPEILKIVDLSNQPVQNIEVQKSEPKPENNPEPEHVPIHELSLEDVSELERPSSPPKSYRKKASDPELFWPQEEQY